MVLRRYILKINLQNKMYLFYKKLFLIVCFLLMHYIYQCIKLKLFNFVFIYNGSYADYNTKS
jgi:hypothetical protein